ncbi:MAG: hypothetical protein M1825_005896 [Sarcosagium campestre]|nr:MAG: hypothetical protein M1825_005896 [Sarcosagium campestre]
MPPPPLPDSHRSRASTWAQEARMNARLSISLPHQSHSGASSHANTPSSSASATPVTPAPMSPLDKGLPSPTEPSGFLVALAAQERKVLELKEELTRAEVDLERLKRQWARQEAAKKMRLSRHGQQLQPLGTVFGSIESSGDESINSSRSAHEREKRRSLANASKLTQRKVISGHGHTRALSLLSPDRMNVPQPLPSTPGPDSGASKAANLPRSATAPDPIRQSAVTIPEKEAHVEEKRPQQRPRSGPPKEDLLRTGRQMAEDFKEGLWTFFDDLRQATVGDEAVHGPHNRPPHSPQISKGVRKQGSKSSIRSNHKQSPTRHGPGPLTLTADPTTQKVHQRTKSDASIPPATSSLAASPRLSTSTAQSEGGESPSAASSSPRTSTSSTGHPPKTLTRLTPSSVKDDVAAWTSLNKLSPSNLQRTASSLMEEWEKSLLNAPGTPTKPKGEPEDIGPAGLI